MIRVTVEIIPGGLESHPRRRTIGVVEIANVGGTDTVGDYRYSLTDKRGAEDWRSGSVQNFPRARLGVYDLLYRCLRDCLGARNGDK